MKITSILILKDTEDGEPVLLASATDLSSFGYFQRGTVKEMIWFVSRTIARRTPPGRRQSVEHEEYLVHCYNRNNLVGMVFANAAYPTRSAFSVINKDPVEADKLMKIQKELDETKFILHKTIDSVLERGEKLDTLVEKSNDLSMASQLFYQQAKKNNQCCKMV
ncbi:unnamed protein product [Closterium sp. NIES-53]